MSDIQLIDVLIVGAGPSGTSTALHLVRSDPAWAKRIVIVDKAVHPREKICGGGITHMGRNVISGLGLELEVEHFDVNEVKVTYRDKGFTFYGKPVFTIVRRDEFDAWLVKTAVKQGITVRQGEAVKNVISHDEYVEVVTDKATFHAKTVVAADGSNSFVRRTLKWDGDSHVARLIEVLTPENADSTPAFRDRIALFEFDRLTTHELQGYNWDFPSYVQKRPFMNRGVFDSRAQPHRPKADLKATLADALVVRDRDLDDYKIKGFPIRWWDKNGRFAQPRILLAGDAAGADPLLGEGISFALGYGKVAAIAINHAFAQEEYSYANYRTLLLADPLFKQLNTRTRLAKLAYKKWPSWVVRLLWNSAGRVIKYVYWRTPDDMLDEISQPIWK